MKIGGIDYIVLFLFTFMSSYLFTWIWCFKKNWFITFYIILHLFVHCKNHILFPTFSKLINYRFRFHFSYRIEFRFMQHWVERCYKFYQFTEEEKLWGCCTLTVVYLKIWSYILSNNPNTHFIIVIQNVGYSQNPYNDMDFGIFHMPKNRTWHQDTWLNLGVTYISEKV